MSVLKLLIAAVNIPLYVFRIQPANGYLASLHKWVLLNVGSRNKVVLTGNNPASFFIERFVEI